MVLQDQCIFTNLKGKRLEIKQKAQEPHDALFFISMTSDLIIIDQTSFPHERATIIDYFPLHNSPVAANPSLSSLAHTRLHRPNRHQCNITLYTEHKNKMCRGACTSTLHKKNLWGCPNSTCYRCSKELSH